MAALQGKRREIGKAVSYGENQAWTLPKNHGLSVKSATDISRRTTVEMYSVDKNDKCTNIMRLSSDEYEKLHNNLPFMVKKLGQLSDERVQKLSSGKSPVLSADPVTTDCSQESTCDTADMQASLGSEYSPRHPSASRPKTRVNRLTKQLDICLPWEKLSVLVYRYSIEYGDCEEISPRYYFDDAICRTEGHAREKEIEKDTDEFVWLMICEDSTEIPCLFDLCKMAHIFLVSKRLHKLLEQRCTGCMANAPCQDAHMGLIGCLTDPSYFHVQEAIELTTPEELISFMEKVIKSLKLGKKTGDLSVIVKTCYTFGIENHTAKQVVDGQFFKYVPSDIIELFQAKHDTRLTLL